MSSSPAPAPAGAAPVARVLADGFAGIDATMRHIVQTLIAAGPGELVEQIPAQLWIEQTCRILARDARRVLTVAEVLPDLPQLAAAWHDGIVVWTQITTIAAAAARRDRDTRAELDHRLAHAAVDLADAAPGTLLDVLDRICDQLHHRRLRDRERRLQRGRFLHVQPFVTGDGGSLYGEFDAAALATITDAVDHAAPPPDLHPNPRHDPHTTAANARSIATARAQGLLRLAATAGHTPHPATADAPADAPADAEVTALDPGQWDRLARRPLLLAHIDLQSLLGMAKLPGQLLTTLTGGTLRISAHAARELATTPQGADLRLLIRDGTGGTVGVGRRTRLTPGWLRDATIAAHPVCTFPSCTRPARLAQIDHAHPWDDHGRTDHANLGPLCAAHHTTKTRRLWHLTRHPDGTCTWRHHTGTTYLQPSNFRLDQLAHRRRPR